MNKREYYAKNREKILLKAKEYYSKPEIKRHKKEYDKKYYSQEQIKQRTKEYQKQYCQREYVKEKDRLRRQEQPYKERRKKYSLKIREGQIYTPSLKKLEPDTEEIKKLYLSGYDSFAIAEKFGVSRPTIISFLKHYNIRVKNRKFMGRKKEIICSNGQKVWSNPERQIIEYLLQKGIEFIYEQRIICEKQLIKPDFFLPKQDMYIEYAGLMEYEWYRQQIEKKQEIMNLLNKKYFILTKPEQIVEVLLLNGNY